MSFNKSHFWFGGKQWEFISHMTDERLQQISASLNEQSLKCNKICLEINRRVKHTQGFNDKDVIKINKCTNLFNKPEHIKLDTMRVPLPDHITSNIMLFDKETYTDNDVDKIISDLFNAIDPMSDEYQEQVKDSEEAALHEELGPDVYYGPDYNQEQLEESIEFKFNKLHSKN